MGGGRGWWAGWLAVCLLACSERGGPPSNTPSEDPPTEQPAEDPSVPPGDPSLPVEPEPARVRPARNVAFTPSLGGGTLTWDPPEGSPLPVTGWLVRVGGDHPFLLAATDTSLPLRLPWPQVTTVELIALSGEQRSEPVMLRELQAVEPVHMAAWVLTGEDSERRVRLYLARSVPQTVSLRVTQGPSWQPATLKAPLPETVTVGPEPVTLEFTWDVSQDCRGDHPDLHLSAHADNTQVGAASTSA